MGGQISWLLPAALISLVLLAWASRHSARTDRQRAAALLWGGWLLLTAGVFSLMAGIIHPYYTVALAPAIAALVGIGAVTAWRARHGWTGRGALAAMTAATAIWSWVLLDRTPGWHPWLRLIAALAGLLAAALLLAGPRLAGLAATSRGSRALTALPAAVALAAGLAGPVAYSLETVATAHTGALPSAGPAVTSFGGPGGGGFPGGGVLRGAGRGSRGGPGFAGAGSGRGFAGAGSGRGFAGTGSGTGSGSGAAGAGALGGPPASAGPGGQAVPGGTAGRPGRPAGLGAAGRPAGIGPGFGGPGAGGGAGAGGGLGGSTAVSSAVTALLKNDTAGYRWAAATVGAESAAPLQLASRRPIMAIGGFNGTDPAPALREFEHYVAAGEIRFFVGASNDSFGGGSGVAAQITAWVKDHFRSRTVGGLTIYDLTRPLS